MSIRNQLLFRLISISIILVGGTAWFAYQDVRHETRELFDAQLARSARLILSLAQSQNINGGFSKIQEYLDENGLAVRYIDTDGQDKKLNEKIAHVYETKLSFQIWDNEGNLLVKSYNAPLQPITDKQAGFSNTVIDNYGWRSFSLRSSNEQYLCITAERIDVRNDLTGKISNDLFYMFIILIPALFLIMFFSIYQGLKPLQRLAAQINRRSGDNLDLIANANDHAEISTIKNALNRLLKRLNETLAREKRITSDAAHELRTPLAAIRLHTELARSAKNQQQQNESLDQVIHSVDRTTHLVEQLLTLARLEPELLARDFTEIDLTALIIEESALLSPLAIDKNIEIAFNETPGMPIHGNDSSLRLLIRNLLTNAIAYTPANGSINISLTQKKKQTILIVEDNGPGISEEDRKRVLERFYRAENHQVSGCGIGLSIVDRVVQMHCGRLQLCQADGGQGLKVIIQF
jgi:two-component system sensor histidine kinase QseC